MTILISILFICIASFFFAKVEIAIEGSRGWGEGLPTWKLSANHWISKIFFDGRPATGYHVWVSAFLLFLFHIIYLFQPISLSAELKLISLFILFWVIEDFLWFILNPAFGLKNFKEDKIWWHKGKWWGIAPRGYFIFLVVSAALYFLSLYY